MSAFNATECMLSRSMAWLMSRRLKDSLSRMGTLWGFASASGPDSSGLSLGVDSEEFAPSDLDAAMAGEALLAAVAGVDVVAGAVVDVAGAGAVVVATPAPLLLLLETMGSADADGS